MTMTSHDSVRLFRLTAALGQKQRRRQGGLKLTEAVRNVGLQTTWLLVISLLPSHCPECLVRFRSRCWKSWNKSSWHELWSADHWTARFPRTKGCMSRTAQPVYQIPAQVFCASWRVLEVMSTSEIDSAHQFTKCLVEKGIWMTKRLYHKTEVVAFFLCKDWILLSQFPFRWSASSLSPWSTSLQSRSPTCLPEFRNSKHLKCEFGPDWGHRRIVTAGAKKVFAMHTSSQSRIEIHERMWTNWYARLTISEKILVFFVFFINTGSLRWIHAAQWLVCGNYSLVLGSSHPTWAVSAASSGNVVWFWLSETCTPVEQDKIFYRKDDVFCLHSTNLTQQVHTTFSTLGCPRIPYWLLDDCRTLIAAFMSSNCWPTTDSMPAKQQLDAERTPCDVLRRNLE